MPYTAEYAPEPVCGADVAAAPAALPPEAAAPSRADDVAAPLPEDSALDRDNTGRADSDTLGEEEDISGSAEGPGSAGHSALAEIAAPRPLHVSQGRLIIYCVCCKRPLFAGQSFWHCVMGRCSHLWTEQSIRLHKWSLCYCTLLLQPSFRGGMTYIATPHTDRCHIAKLRAGLAGKPGPSSLASSGEQADPSSPSASLPSLGMPWHIRCCDTSLYTAWMKVTSEVTTFQSIRSIAF